MFFKYIFHIVSFQESKYQTSNLWKALTDAEQRKLFLKFYDGAKAGMTLIARFVDKTRNLSISFVALMNLKRKATVKVLDDSNFNSVD